MTQFDLMSLGSIALLALSMYQAYRSWDRDETVLSLVLLAVSLLQILFLLQIIEPWGALSVSTWTLILAGMMASLSLGLLHMDLADYGRTVVILVLLISLAQLLGGSGIVG